MKGTTMYEFQIGRLWVMKTFYPERFPDIAKDERYRVATDEKGQ